MHEEVKAFIEKVKKIHGPLFAEAKNVLEDDDVQGVYHAAKDRTFDVIVLTDAITRTSHWKDDVKKIVGLLAPAGSLLLTVAGQTREGAEPLPKKSPKPLEMRELLTALYQHATFKGATVEDDPKTGSLRFFGWRCRK